MPRKRKNDLRDAIFAVHDGASKRDAAKEFGIPLTTLTLLSKLLKTVSLADVFS